jgi:ornithine carbamoyltransferase
MSTLQQPSAASAHTFISFCQVNKAMMGYADSDAVFLHCLPRHQEEVDDEVGLINVTNTHTHTMGKAPSW